MIDDQARSARGYSRWRMLFCSASHRPFEPCVCTVRSVSFFCRNEWLARHRIHTVSLSFTMFSLGCHLPVTPPTRVYYSLAPPKFSHLYLLLTCASTTHLRLRTSHLCLRPAHLRLHFLLTYASLLSHLRLLYNLAFDWKCLLSFFPQCHDLKPGLLLKLHTPLPSTMPSSEI